MRSWLYVLILLVAMVVDVSVLGGNILVPPLSAAFLVVVLVFAPRRVAYTAAGFFALLLWTLSAQNLGIIIFSTGVLIFYEHWVLEKMFRRRTAQVAALAGLGAPLFVVILLGLEALLRNQPLVDLPHFAALLGTAVAGVALATGAYFLHERYA
jgi:hypothetical protein